MICVGWPISSKVEGYERIFVYITPLIGISFLNVEAFVSASLMSWVWAIAGSGFFFMVSLLAFKKGLTKYQSGNIIRLQ